MSENNLPNEGMENENEEVVNSNEEVSSTYEGTETEPEDTMESAEEGMFSEEGENEAEEAASFSGIGDNEVVKAQKAASNFKTSATIAWILVVLLLAVDAWYYMTNIYNKYNHKGYLNVNGYTIGEVVAGMGMDFDEFKEMYGLPADMRKDTYMNAAQSMIPVSKMAEMNGMDLDSLKSSYKFGDEINENSTWGEAIDSMQLRDYVGEDQFEEFKTQYNLGEEVTLDTKWGDIRKTVEKLQIAERIAKENEASASPSASPEASDGATTPDAQEDTGSSEENSGEATPEPTAEAE